MYVFYTLSTCEVLIAQQWYSSALQTESKELWNLFWDIWNRFIMAIVFLYAYYIIVLSEDSVSTTSYVCRVLCTIE